MENQNENSSNALINRLIEVNEKRSKAADIKFYITAGLLLLSLVGNIYQATQPGEVSIKQENSVSDHNINGKFE